MKITKYKIERYTGEQTLCDDCESYEGKKYIARWLVIGAGPTGYLYLCNDCKENFEEDAEQDY